MKKLIFTLVLSAVLLACKKDKTPESKPVDLSVHVAHELTSSNYTLPVNNVKIRITNINTSAVQELNSDDKGQVTFKAIPAGTYDIDAILEISAANYSRLTGVPTENAVTFNASEKNKQVDGSFGSLDLKLLVGKSGDWVIKQIYFAGSNTADGAVFRDQFIEFYNNTNAVLYADSLYFAQVYGRGQANPTSFNLLGNGQYDWSKAQGMPSGIDANRDYVYAKTLLMIPGTGKQYPVQPGESIVVAQTALNHKSPFTGNDGKVYSVKKPELTVDLSKADFEAYYGDIIVQNGGKVFASDIDNPQVPNLEILAYSGNDLILDNKGRDSYVIFKVDGSQKVKSWPQYYEPTKADPKAGAKKYYQIPVKYVIDGVEVQPNTADDRLPKKLNPGLDAGFTFVPKGEYTSQSVIRKTSKTVNGKRILKDTNNSTEDFDVFDTAQPKGFK